MVDLIFAAQFVTAQVGKTGLTVTVDVDRYTISDGSRTALVTGGAATEGRRGLYSYRLASADLALYQYIATFITTNTTVDQQEIPALGLVVPDALTSAVTAVVDYASVRAAVGLASANLDTQLDALPTAAEAATATAAAILAAANSDPISANVTHSAGIATGGRLAEVTDLPAAAPSAVDIRTEMDANSTKLASILEDTGTTLPAALVTIDGIVDDILVDTGTTLPALINTRATLGAGALTFTYTLLSSVDESPIADADVWVSSDEAGSILLASGRTNASGQVVFYLDAGTVYVWRQKSGWNFTNPDTETVS